MNSIYKRIAIVIAVVVATVGVLLSDFNMPQIQIAFFNPIQQVEYVELRKIAQKTVRGENIENIEGLEIEKIIEEDSINVTVKNTNRYIKVEATFPIDNYNVEIENNNIYTQGTIDFENATYENISSVFKPLTYILVDIMMFVYYAFIGYSVLYIVPDWIYKLIQIHKKEEEMT